MTAIRKRPEPIAQLRFLLRTFMPAARPRAQALALVREIARRLTRKESGRA